MLAGVICGPTAVGKSSLALALAKRQGFEILSADSRQVYRGLPLGTNQPDEAERAAVPHHFVGFLPPEESFSPRHFARAARALLRERPQQPFLLVGGTGLYIKELLFGERPDRGETPPSVRNAVAERVLGEGLPSLHRQIAAIDSEAARKIHPHDRYRIVKWWENHAITGEAYSRLLDAPAPAPEFSAAPLLLLTRPRDELYGLIDARTAAMVRAGWQEEAARLRARDPSLSLPAFSALGYREMASAPGGEDAAAKAGLEEAAARIAQKTRQYAKRQLTFFRRQFPASLFPGFRDAHPQVLEKALQDPGFDWRAFCSALPVRGPDPSEAEDFGP